MIQVDICGRCGGAGSQAARAAAAGAHQPHGASNGEAAADGIQPSLGAGSRAPVTSSNSAPMDRPGLGHIVGPGLLVPPRVPAAAGRKLTSAGAVMPHFALLAGAVIKERCRVSVQRCSPRTIPRDYGEARKFPLLLAAFIHIRQLDGTYGRQLQTNQNSGIFLLIALCWWGRK